jgi:predicted XRE-type DNA-binding protein
MPKHLIPKTATTPEQILEALLNHTLPTGECLEWGGACATDGYPIRYGNKKVHRTVAELKYQQDITGVVVRHTCDNIKCINPNHLILGTPIDNIHDMDVRGRRFRLMTGEMVLRVKELLATKKLNQTEIAKITGLNVRRVSDINCNKYTNEGKLAR